jgi:hypothetical protein
MPATSSQTYSVQYSERSLHRAARAIRCSPFRLHLFNTMCYQSVGLKAIAGRAGLQNQYTQRVISDLAAENGMLWLIQVGVLRREVDGQGITDSFRLTPLCRYLLENASQSRQRGDRLTQPSIADHLLNFLTRWLRRLF